MKIIFVKKFRKKYLFTYIMYNQELNNLISKIKIYKIFNIISFFEKFLIGRFTSPFHHISLVFWKLAN